MKSSVRIFLVSVLCFFTAQSTFAQTQTFEVNIGKGKIKTKGRKANGKKVKGKVKMKGFHYKSVKTKNTTTVTTSNNGTPITTTTSSSTTTDSSSSSVGAEVGLLVAKSKGDCNKYLRGSENKDERKKCKKDIILSGSYEVGRNNSETVTTNETATVDESGTARVNNTTRKKINHKSNEHGIKVRVKGRVIKKQGHGVNN